MMERIERLIKEAGDLFEKEPKSKALDLASGNMKIVVNFRNILESEKHHPNPIIAKAWKKTRKDNWKFITTLSINDLKALYEDLKYYFEDEPEERDDEVLKCFKCGKEYKRGYIRVNGYYTSEGFFVCPDCAAREEK